MIEDVLPSSEAIFIFAHGAGAGMDHPLMQMFSEKLNYQNIGTIRFNFPFLEKGRKVPGSQKEAVESIAVIYNEVSEKYKLPLFAGGKSYGGRMASIAASQGLLPRLNGLIFLGFPLHAPGKPSLKRAEHLSNIGSPMLFLQGTKDKLSDINLIKKIISQIPSAFIEEYEDADHSFKVPKRSGINQEELYNQIALDISLWIGKINKSISSAKH